MFDTITNYEFESFTFRDNWKTIAIAVAIFLGLYLTLSWIATNVVGQTEVIFVYFSLLLLFGAAYAANLLKSRIKKLEPLPFGTVSIGWNPKAIAVLSLVGLGLGYFMVTQQLTVALPLDVTYQQVVSGMDFSYKVVMSPIIEEMFRAVVLISVALITWRFSKNWMVGLLTGLLVSAFAFGIFHWLAYQQDVSFISAAIIFGLIAGLLMLASKSILPAIAFHYANNQLIYSQGNPIELIIVSAVIIALLVLLLFRRA